MREWKKCSGCKVDKWLDGFRKNQSQCKDCQRLAAKTYRNRRSLEEQREYMREYRQRRKAAGQPIPRYSRYNPNCLI